MSDKDETRENKLGDAAAEMARQFGFRGIAIVGLTDTEMAIGGAGISNVEMPKVLSRAARSATEHVISTVVDKVLAEILTEDRAANDASPAPDIQEGTSHVEAHHMRVAGICEVCKREVSALLSRPPEVDMVCGVCDCGSFVMPKYADDGALCGVRSMTLEEVAELPDDVRNVMLKRRREMQREAQEAQR